MGKNLVFVYIWLFVELYNYWNIVFDRARRATSGTQHFLAGTCVIANCFGKNANRLPTSLTFNKLLFK